MKKFVLYLLLAGIFTSVYAFQTKGGEWKPVANKKLMDANTAYSIVSYDAKDAESVTRYFYASRIRGTQDWRKVTVKLESEWTVKMKEALSASAYWKFKKVGLQQIRKMFEGEIRIKIYYEADEKGKLKKGTGEVVLQKIDNKWTVVEVPC